MLLTERYENRRIALTETESAGPDVEEPSPVHLPDPEPLMPPGDPDPGFFPDPPQPPDPEPAFPQ